MMRTFRAYLAAGLLGGLFGLIVAVVAEMSGADMAIVERKWWFWGAAGAWLFLVVVPAFWRVERGASR